MTNPHGAPWLANQEVWISLGCSRPGYDGCRVVRVWGYRNALHHILHQGNMRCVTVGAMLLTMLIFWLIVILSVRLAPVVRHGRKATLPRPKPCSMRDAQQAVDRLIAAGFDAEIAEHDDNGLNVWANTPVGGEVRPDERYVVRVPRRQAAAASRI